MRGANIEILMAHIVLQVHVTKVQEEVESHWGYLERLVVQVLVAVIQFAETEVQPWLLLVELREGHQGYLQKTYAYFDIGVPVVLFKLLFVQQTDDRVIHGCFQLELVIFVDGYWRYRFLIYKWLALLENLFRFAHFIIINQTGKK